MLKKSFREAGARIFQEESERDAPSVISLLAARAPTAVRQILVGKIVPNPSQPRLTWQQETLNELAASIREHGVLQPILVRPAGEQYEIIAGERRWRASKLAGRETVPAIVERFDDATALEIALIENLQREDLSPLDEAFIYKKMTDELGYSIRSLAQKLAKDKGYVENRLRLATAPDDVRQMVAQRYDTLAAAYELMQLEDRKRRRALARRVVEGKLTLIRLREVVDRLTGKALPKPATAQTLPVIKDGDLFKATRKLNDALGEIGRLIGADGHIPDTDRDNLAKFLTITRTRMENLVARLRARAAR